jgi:hypothetical protein
MLSGDPPLRPPRGGAGGGWGGGWGLLAFGFWSMESFLVFVHPAADAAAPVAATGPAGNNW